MEAEVRICEWCKRPIERTTNKGQPPKFCKPSHKQRAYEVRRLEMLLSSDAGQQMLAEAVSAVMERRAESWTRV